MNQTAFHRFCLLLVAATILLLLVGALVTSNEAGDSVPDWPMSFGRWLIGSSQFTGNVRFEYSHRVAAGLVGILTAVAAAWAWLSRSADSRLRRLTLAALSVVILQALLGGLRVLFPAAKPAIAVPHAFVAQSFFCLVITLAAITSERWLSPPAVGDDVKRVRGFAAASVAAIMIQLILGAAYRHGAIGIIPHVAGAVIVTILVLSAAVRVFRTPEADSYLKRPAWVGVAFLTTQLVLGILAYFSRLASRSDPQPLEPMISLTAGHVIVGALTLGSLLVLMLRSRQVLRPQATRKELEEPYRGTVEAGA